MLEPYGTPAGVEAAIKAAAARAARDDPSLTVGQRVRLEHFNRFLSRVFSDGESSEWLLKGGTGMLARVASSRATQDIDLAGHGFTLDEMLGDLIRLSQVDLDDHFRFVLADRSESMGADHQPYIDGYRVTFDVYVGGAPRGSVKVDLAAGLSVTGDVTRSEPVNALDLPRLVSNRYRLYPVVDQIADKVCATMADYGGRPSSREKDLVDLVVLATTQAIEGSALHLAIETECSRRKLEPFDRFTVPATWGAGYVRQSKSVPYCGGYPTVERAAQLVASLIDPVLTGTAHGKAWSCNRLVWS